MEPLQTRPTLARTATRGHPARRRSAPAPLAIGMAAALCCLALPASADTAYDALIERARAGEYEPALAALRERVARTPGDRRAAYDRIVIAGWAGRSAEVIRAYRELGDAATLSGTPRPTCCPPWRARSATRSVGTTRCRSTALPANASPLAWISRLAR